MKETMATRKRKSDPGCGCRAKANTALAPHNTRLTTNVGVLMHPRRAARSVFRLTTERILLATERIEPRSRKRPLVVAATYCPFCGRKLPESEGT